MCRWVAYFGEEPSLLEDVLVRPKHSLCNQVHDHYLPGLLHTAALDSGLDVSKEKKEIDLRNRLFNIDGVGIGYYSAASCNYDVDVDGPRPSLYKTVRPPLNDLNFRHLCRNTESNVIFGHIRMAESVVAENNNHPFAFGQHLFQHNGSVGNFGEIHRSMIDCLSPMAWANVSGTTDSEVMAAMFFTYLTEKTPDAADAFYKNYPMEEMKDALFRTLKKIEELQHSQAKEFVPSALNIAITNGSSLLCLRYLPLKAGEPPSLYYSTSAGLLLNRKFKGHPDGVQQPEHKESKKKPDEEHARHIVVGSEPSTYDAKAWKLIPKNSVLTVEGLGGEVEIQKVPGW